MRLKEGKLRGLSRSIKNLAWQTKLRIFTNILFSYKLKMLSHKYGDMRCYSTFMKEDKTIKQLLMYVKEFSRTKT